MPLSYCGTGLCRRCKIAARVFRRFYTVFPAIAACVFAQDAVAPVSILSNRGEPMKVAFVCAQEDLAASGMSCSDDDPCPIYLELSGVSAKGAKLSLAGNVHGGATTLDSVLLLSDDGGATWKEPAARVPAAALDQVELFDATHGWAAGEIQVPLTRDPFFLITADGGLSWHRKSLTEDGTAGAVQKFWFDSVNHGQLIVDAGRYTMYESTTGGESWNIVSKTAQPPRLKGAPPVEDVDYRIGTDNARRAYVVEKREGERWTRVASFLVQVASCGARPITPEPPSPGEPGTDAK